MIPPIFSPPDSMPSAVTSPGRPLPRDVAQGRLQSVRGKFSFGPNQHPIQDYYLTKFEKNASREIVQTVVRKIASDYGDAYSAKCQMK